MVTAVTDARPPRSAALLATAVAVPVVVLAVILAIALLRPTSLDDTPLDDMAAPASSDPACAALIEALPSTFDGFAEREGDGLLTWRRSADDGAAIKLRCGVDAPPNFTQASRVDELNKTTWFQTTQEGRAHGALWYAVDYRPYVALWLPEGAGTGPIQTVSAAITAKLKESPLEFTAAVPTVAGPSSPALPSTPVPSPSR